jgi:hypothetical protein
MKKKKPVLVSVTHIETLCPIDKVVSSLPPNTKKVALELSPQSYKDPGFYNYFTTLAKSLEKKCINIYFLDSSYGYRYAVFRDGTFIPCQHYDKEKDIIHKEALKAAYVTFPLREDFFLNKIKKLEKEGLDAVIMGYIHADELKDRYPFRKVIDLSDRRGAGGFMRYLDEFDRLCRKRARELRKKKLKEREEKRKKIKAQKRRK